MKPKYNYNDSVSFDLNGQTITGTVYIIDANGTWENPDEVSYDIKGTWNGVETLFKHIKESELLKTPEY